MYIAQRMKVDHGLTPERPESVNWPIHLHQVIKPIS
jgi:hypothetical protein